MFYANFQALSYGSVPAVRNIMLMTIKEPNSFTIEFSVTNTTLAMLTHLSTVYLNLGVHRTHYFSNLCSYKVFLRYSFFKILLAVI